MQKIWRDYKILFKKNLEQYDKLKFIYIIILWKAQDRKVKHFIKLQILFMEVQIFDQDFNPTKFVQRKSLKFDISQINP